MSEFSLNDAVGGQQSQGQNANNQWGGQNPNQSGGYPSQPFQGYPAAGQGQQYPGYPQGGQQYPGYPQGGQQYPGFAPGGQQFPGFPGYPGCPTPGQSFPGGPAPGQPTDPKMAGQGGPMPSAPAGPLNLPYTIPLNSGIQPGLVLTFEGSVNPDCKRFTVDIKNGDDIACHMNPRFDENPHVVVRNTCIRGQWGSEERAGPKFPFQKGQTFKIQIFCDPDQYRIVINNEPFCQYRHRDKAFQQIRSVCIHGNITLTAATVNMM